MLQQNFRSQERSVGGIPVFGGVHKRVSTLNISEDILKVIYDLTAIEKYQLKNAVHTTHY